MGQGDISTADTMRERAGESRVKLWVLLGVNRLLLTGILTGFVFVIFVLGVAGLSPPFVQQIAAGDMLDTLFSTMITVIVTGTTLVVTIGQLVLSQENGPLGDQRDRMASSMDVREFTGELTGTPSPTDPAEFLSELLEATVERAETVRESLAESRDGDLGAEVEEFTDSTIGNADLVREQLDGARFGSFHVLFAALNFNYGWKIYQVERISTEYEDRLTEQDQRVLDDLKTSLSLFGPAREHVKTLYFQWALIDLSQLILYAAVPALAVAGVMVGVVDAGTVPGSTFGVANLVFVVGGAFAVTLVPFLLFVSYLLRILTVAKRTLAIEPLILRDTNR